MKVLAITGRIAELEVKKMVSNLDFDVDVYVMPVTVAAFLTPKMITENLREVRLPDYDMILIPGTVKGDVSEIEDVIGIPCFKGPVHASEIPLALEPDINLSKVHAANILFKEQLRDKALSELEYVEENWDGTLAEYGGVLIGQGEAKVPVGDGFPMRVLAEIVNAPLLDMDSIEQKVIYYENQGAHIIDVGMLAGDPRPSSIAAIFETIKGVTNLPISIDSLDSGEIKSAIDSDVDLILSLDSGNIHDVAPVVDNTPTVILPTNMSEGRLSGNPIDRVRHMEKNINLAKEYGMENIIADLVVEPLINPGLLSALKSYSVFKAQNPGVPILFGIGNVTELIDADSVGVNAAISAIACETGANMLHIPEYSDKTHGSVKEVVTASKMMWLAKKKGTLPKDLGIDLLILKEKRRIEEVYNSSIESNYDVIRGYPEDGFNMDPEGWFKILLDRETNNIVALHYPLGEEEPDILIKGSNSKEIYQTIIRENLISKFDHAAYLGKELEKAFIALKIGRSYVQDDPLFN